MSAPIREHVATALRNVRAHPMRSLLTTLGIIIGVFAVVSVVSVTESLKLRLLKEMRADKGRVFTLSPWTRAVEEGEVRYQAFAPAQVQELRAVVPELEVVSPRVFLGELPIKFRATQKSTRVMGVDENGLYLMSFEVAHGREFTPTDRTTTQPVAILGATIAQDLGIEPKDIGRTLTIAGQTAELVGILSKPSTAMGSYLGQMVMVPYGSFRGIGRQEAFSRPTWTLLMSDRLSVNDAKDRVRLALRRIRGLRASDPDNFTIRTNEQSLQQIGKITTALMAAAGGMVGISLLVGGIGVMNIMLVTVTERTREIGLRKSLGARRREIMIQFLMEASILCGLGGLVGLILGAALGDVVGRIWIKATAGVPAWALLSAFFVPVAVGLGFGLYPARRAARMDPIEALRQE